jgi:hypothetical protein
MLRIRSSALVALLAVGMHGCKKDAASATAPAIVTSVQIVQGNAQVRQAGRRLPQPLVFRATDAADRGVPGAQLTLLVESGGGAVDSASIRTDANGEARIRWTLGPGGTQALLASAPGATPVRASATALLPTDLLIAQGNNQTAKAGTALPNAIVVRVLGANNTPMDSITVSVQVTAGGGAVSPQSVVTNTLGEATVRWTLGTVPGSNAAAVRAATLDPVMMSATGTP